MLSCSLLIGCQDFGERFAARNHRRTYERWLIAQKPFLAGPPKPVFYRHEFNLMNYSEPGFRPEIVYYLKAGDSVGLLKFDFFIELDKKGNPVGMHEEHLTFIRLPASGTSIDDKGQRWNAYWGLQLDPKQMQDMVKRVVAHDDFEDLVNKPEREYHSWARSVRADIDDWKYLKGSQH